MNNHMTILVERGALNRVPMMELVQWANRNGLELVANLTGGMTLRQRPTARTQEQAQ